MEDKLKILIADDHPIFRRGLREVMEEDAGLLIVGEAGNGLIALQQIEQLQPDIAVLDIDMPQLSGFEVVKELQRKNLPVKIIFLTMHRDEDLFNEALSLGARGYVLKDSAATEAVACIHTVAGGQHYISPVISTYLVRRSERLAAFAQETAGLSALTPAELRVLKLIATNKTSREIASELFLSYRTVENHRSNICQKLNLRGSHALVKFAFEHKSQLS
jgi:DNA-binding NarL/FixJ family response regulator